MLGENSLHLAIDRNDVQMVKILLDADGECIINVPTSGKESQTPLHLAIKKSGIGMVRQLMNYYK